MGDETTHEIVVTITSEHIFGSYRDGDDTEAIVDAIEDALDASLELTLHPTGGRAYPDDIEEPQIRISVASVKPARLEPTSAQVEAATRGYLSATLGSALTDREWEAMPETAKHRGQRHMRAALLAMWRVGGKP